MCFHIQTGLPCRQATTSSVVKVLLEKIIPTWGIPLKFHGDQGTHFTDQALQQVCYLASFTTLSLCLPL